jgi:hypothetical protein
MRLSLKTSSHYLFQNQYLYLAKTAFKEDFGPLALPAKERDTKTEIARIDPFQDV